MAMSIKVSAGSGVQEVGAVDVDVMEAPGEEVAMNILVSAGSGVKEVGAVDEDVMVEGGNGVEGVVQGGEGEEGAGSVK